MRTLRDRPSWRLRVASGSRCRSARRTRPRRRRSRARARLRSPEQRLARFLRLLDLSGSCCRTEDSRVAVVPADTQTRRLLGDDLLDDASPRRLSNALSLDHDPISRMRFHGVTSSGPTLQRPRPCPLGTGPAPRPRNASAVRLMPTPAPATTTAASRSIRHAALTCWVPNPGVRSEKSSICSKDAIFDTPQAARPVRLRRRRAHLLALCRDRRARRLDRNRLVVVRRCSPDLPRRQFARGRVD